MFHFHKLYLKYFINCIRVQTSEQGMAFLLCKFQLTYLELNHPLNHSFVSWSEKLQG